MEDTMAKPSIYPKEYRDQMAKECYEWEKMLPWNIDLNRLNKHRAMISQAKVDENRKEPYILCGNSR